MVDICLSYNVIWLHILRKMVIVCASGLPKSLFLNFYPDVLYPTLPYRIFSSISSCGAACLYSSVRNVADIFDCPSTTLFLQVSSIRFRTSDDLESDRLFTVLGLLSGGKDNQRAQKLTNPKPVKHRFIL